jgi:hypothetical protein
MLPTAEDDSHRIFLANVERVGWHIVGIDADGEGPGYAFSVGLFHTLQHPEIIIFGLPNERVAELINIIGIQVQGGARFNAGDQSNDIVDGFPVAFTDVPKNVYKEYVGYALWFYKSFDFPVLQCVWPDKSGLFPWQEGYDRSFIQLQPLLTNIT